MAEQTIKKNFLTNENFLKNSQKDFSKFIKDFEEIYTQASKVPKTTNYIKIPTISYLVNQLYLEASKCLKTLNIKGISYPKLTRVGGSRSQKFLIPLNKNILLKIDFSKINQETQVIEYSVYYLNAGICRTLTNTKYKNKKAILIETTKFQRIFGTSDLETNFNKYIHQLSA